MAEQDTKLKCANCRRYIELGCDLITVEKGVCGPRGVVPLGEVRIFCGEDCLRTFFDGVSVGGLKFSERKPY